MNKGKVQYGAFGSVIEGSKTLTPPTGKEPIGFAGVGLLDPATIGQGVVSGDVGVGVVSKDKPSLLAGLDIGKGVSGEDTEANNKLSEVGRILKEAREQGTGNRMQQPKFQETITKVLDEAADIFLGVHGDTGAKLTEMKQRDNEGRLELLKFKNGEVGNGTSVVNFFDGASEDEVVFITGGDNANVTGNGYITQGSDEINDGSNKVDGVSTEIINDDKDEVPPIHKEESVGDVGSTGDVVVEDGEKGDIKTTDFGKEVEFDYENEADKLEIIDSDRLTYEDILQIAAGRKDTKLPTNVLERYKAPRGKHVEGYYPNSNLVICTYPFKKILKRNDTAMRFMMVDGKPENDRKILDNILSNVVVSCADGRALSTSELLDMLDVHDLKIIYLNSLIVNMVEEDPKNVYLTLSVPCESCGTTHNIKVNVLNLYRDNIDVSAYPNFKMYDKNKMSADLQKNMPVAKTKIVKFEDAEANLIISLALRGVSAERQFMLKDALKEYIVADCKRFIPKEITDIDEQFMWVARNKPLEIQSKSSILGMIAPISAIKIEDKFNKMNTSTITLENHGINTLLEVIDTFSEEIISKMTKIYEDELSSKYPLDMHLRPFKCKSCDNRIIASVDPAQLYFFDLTQRTLQK
ncbi:MAG: hypothetical protein ACRC92_25880 [Peptostreptococcaceae bacterium]